MGTKRKSRGSTRNASKDAVTYNENSRFAPDERFDDSQDEFEAGRDHILLEEAPEAKRRRKLREEGARCPFGYFSGWRAFTDCFE